MLTRFSRQLSRVACKLIKHNHAEEEEEAKPDELVYREDNHIYFYAEVNVTSISILMVLLREAQDHCIFFTHRNRIDELPIYLHLMTNGGELLAAFPMMDVIESSKIPVYSVIEGATASAGTMISVVCHKRFIRPRAYMLIHQLRSGCVGTMRELSDEYSNLSDNMKVIRDIYLRHTKLNSKKLDQLLDHDIWLPSKLAIDYGLADEIYK